ncbi:MAG: 7-carboxy-7-deazaguanine synthase QueE [Gammaproteobacteria bacterium]|nr:7-carboxy-7-deazaguanine synthase QueE [Gammaproteobacteria bacterium]MBT4493046.1 7-carboxy-7-deazaguanine synthase QueE [Gammaproteobacteria bacterium]MBT7371698.1 7-carboxy-7-deazaguanine synthase QueE [Gammaproteobacteria bacterium]
MQEIRITEIFHSLQGEANTVGLPTAFIRLTGCPLRCQYCDTAYAFSGGEQMSTADILERVGSRRVQNVTVTGGEPLAQPECIPLLSLLCDHGYRVSLETSGAMAVDEVDERVSIVVDLKTPGSGEVSRNLYENLGKLKDNDQVKFVICNRGDYEWARDRVEEFNLEQSVSEVLFSASHTELSSTELANWILEDQLQVRLQIQLHKILWGDKPGV